MLTVQSITYMSPIGLLEITGSEKGISRISLIEEQPEQSEALGDVHPHIRDCASQLDEYFGGMRQKFHSLPLHMMGTDFQLDVWNALLEIDHGHTDTYSGIAEKIGNDNAARAVGNALNANPLMIIVPCHRVLPMTKKDRIGGFAHGARKKAWLLRHEGALEDYPL